MVLEFFLPWEVGYIGIDYNVSLASLALQCILVQVVHFLVKGFLLGFRGPKISKRILVQCLRTILY